MKNIFISCPVNVSLHQVEKVAQKLYELGNCNVAFYNRNTYRKELFENADMLVVMAPDNWWNFKIDFLPVGVRKEVNLAIANNIPIYLAYKRTIDGEYCIYKTKIDEGYISGISGSSLTSLPLEIFEKETEINTPINFDTFSEAFIYNKINSLTEDEVIELKNMLYPSRRRLLLCC